ncbi:MAG: hypothetical protein SXA11_23975 [Cyanobacteriota bacterium]|nr:hypothetical protein [Cyanobacteriota bacterium]
MSLVSSFLDLVPMEKPGFLEKPGLLKILFAALDRPPRRCTTEMVLLGSAIAPPNLQSTTIYSIVNC